DGCIWEAGYKDAAGRPTVSLGLKGICYVDLKVRGTAQDAHSRSGGSSRTPRGASPGRSRR
ncbi:MAG TPA: hypothetical protein VF001_09235, partial [Candidatus Limnocylindria bacterium]